MLPRFTSEHVKMSTLTNALPIVAAAYGRKFGVQVQVGGSQACTNGKLIQIPALTDDPEAKLLAYGYLTHEAGHLRHTDFAVWPPTSPVGVFIEGVIEDVRIENALLQDYPGSRVTMDAVMTALIKRQQLVPVTEADEPADVLCNGFLALARYHFRRQKELAVHAQAAESIMRAKFTARFVNRLRGLMTEINGLQSTEDSKVLALKILDLMNEESQPQPPAAQQTGEGQEPQPPDANVSGQGQGSQPATDSGTGNDPDSSQQEQGQKGGSEGANKPETGHQDNDQQQGSEGAGKPEQGHQDSSDDNSGEPDQPGNAGQAGAQEQADAAGQVGNPGQEGAGRSALRAALSAGSDDLPKDVFATVAELLNAAQIHTPTLLPTMVPFSGDHAQGAQMLNQVRKHSAHLTARLQGLVQAQRLTKNRTTKQGRVLDPNRLHRVAVNDARIFARKDHKQQPNTALHLLVDLSSSMRYGQDRTALEAGMALAMALENIPGVTQAITAFPGHQGDSNQVVKLLGHGERVADQVGRFVQEGRGSTPMTGALWFAAADLLARTEPRKVILALTDGEPNHLPSAKDMIKKARQEGIEVIGIGIQQDVRGLFPIAISIHDVGDLKRELFRIAERLLVKG